MKQLPKKSVFVCIGAVRNAQGKILLVRRNEAKLPEAHGKWELPGGGVDFGEKPEDALQREIFEETGYHVKVLSLLPHPYMSLWNYPEVYLHVVIFIFRCELLNKKNASVQKDGEVSEIGWFTPAEIEKMQTLPGTLNHIRQL